MTHQFDVAHAQKYGVTEAVLISYIRYFIAVNQDNKVNFFEGRTWVYHTVAEYQEIFFYLTIRQVRTALNHLVKAGVLITGHFGHPFDRVLWYSFADEGAFLYEAAGDVPRPPDDNKSDRPDISNSSICQDGQMDFEDQMDLSDEANENDADTAFRFVNNDKCYRIVLRRSYNKVREEGESRPRPILKKINPASATPAVCCAAAAPEEPSVNKRRSMFHDDIASFRDSHPGVYPGPFLDDFYRYWSERNQEKTRMRFEDQKYFDLAWRIKGFWKKANDDERRDYWDRHKLRRGCH